ncbi:TPA: hypothetical protein N0F65_004321 [Lagenidium giganteum]|uniref:Transposase n=1 Tax=Lagenidium giganteum TaxID=4803 RepID=A0AAV2Z9V9_9STRA|nr:TPA: hypothetical protein N0F65_004321 [Lagenidium giganteum]
MPTTSTVESHFSLIKNLESDCAHYLSDVSMEALLHGKQYQKKLLPFEAICLFDTSVDDNKPVTSER